MMKKLNLLFGAVLGMLLCAGLVAAAAVSPALSIQGKLTSAQGYPLSGSYPVQFRIFNDATGGTSLWNTNQTVPVTKGIWQTYISPPATLDFNQRLWLEVTVNGETLSPRSELTFGSWSFAASRLLPTIWDIITTGKVGVGTSTPTEKLDVSGNIKVTSNITAGVRYLQKAASTCSVLTGWHSAITIPTTQDTLRYSRDQAHGRTWARGWAT